MMTTEQIYEMMEQGNLGYACVFKPEDHGKHTDFLFPMTPKNIANFIGQNAFTADKIIMTDFCGVLWTVPFHPLPCLPQFGAEKIRNIASGCWCFFGGHLRSLKVAAD